MADFRTPTDAEISEMVGIPVMSFRHDELSHWTALLGGHQDRSQFSDRVLEVKDRWLAFNPAVGDVENLDELARDAATTKTAQITIFRLNGMSRPDFFSILRPAEGPFSQDVVAAKLGISDASIVHKPIPAGESKFISTYHEIGHAVAASQGIDSENPFENELHADRFALERYLDSGGSPETVREYINQRALAGLLQQPHRYWLSIPLSRHFFGDVSDEDVSTSTQGVPSGSSASLDATEGFQGTHVDTQKPEWLIAARANAELRLRVVDITDGERKLTNKSSDAIHAAYDCFCHGELYYDDTLLSRSFYHLDSIRSDPASSFRRRLDDVISAVHEVAVDERVDIVTRQTAQMVIEGAKSHLPDMVPAHAATWANINSRAAKGQGIAGVAVDLAQGNYVSASIGAGVEVADSGIASSLLKAVAHNFKGALGGGLKLIGKRLPVIGAVVTAGFAISESGGYALSGEFRKAGAALAVGAAETVGNIVGFGVGDAAREGARQAFIQVVGDEYSELEVSGLRSLAEDACALMQDGSASEEPPREVVATTLAPKPGAGA